MKSKYLIGIAIILVFLVFAGVNFQQSLTPYVSLETAMKKGTTVQIKGARVAGSEMYDFENKSFRFQMSDGAEAVFPVIYRGVKPSNFEHAKEVVAKGRFRNGVFEADEILIKCPSKYEAENVVTAP
jgi:cytochrome c-type biogenesis protein CcmE